MSDEEREGDEAARQARAKRLHSRIDQLLGKSQPAAKPTEESPNDYVQRRMREEAERNVEKPPSE